MSLQLLIVILVVLMAAVGLLVAILTLGGGGGSSGAKQMAVSDRLRSLVASQRQQESLGGGKGLSQKENLALAAAAESELKRKRRRQAGKMTLEKRLRYAHWPISPIQFRFLQVILAIAFFIPARLHFTFFLQFLFPVMGYLLMGSLLTKAVEKRFNAFDADYPVLLLSYVSLLKTGLNIIGGLESAARGLDETSLVRAEVMLLIERLRLGLTEEQAISAFGEDVAHPELELFVQSLLLSKRVGGQLSSTLERLAKQVRKRQQFRQQAVAAVGMERSSIVAIALIMGGLLVYLLFTSPELVLPAFEHSFGTLVFQGGIFLIIVGFYWSRQVTKIKI